MYIVLCCTLRSRVVHLFDPRALMLCDPPPYRVPHDVPRQLLQGSSSAARKGRHRAVLVPRRFNLYGLKSRKYKVRERTARISRFYTRLPELDNTVFKADLKRRGKKMFFSTVALT